MTHFRRYEFKKRRYCSQPAVANLQDFTDNFVEELKNKIRHEPDCSSSGPKTTAVRANSRHDTCGTLYETHDEVDETSKLINGMRSLGSAANSEWSQDENNLPNLKSSTRKVELAERKPAQVTNGGGSSGGGDSKELVMGSAAAGSVFRSANWLSESELTFSLNNQVGGLVRALRVFQELDIGIKHVESRRSKRRDSEFEIFVDIDCNDREKMRNLAHHLR